MTYTRVFQSGNSQAVRLPKEFRFEVDTVKFFAGVMRLCCARAQLMPSQFLTR